MHHDDIQTIRDFYETQRKNLYAYAMTWTHERESAEDLLNQVFVELLAHDRLPGNLLPYLFRAIRNRAIDQHRKQHREKAYCDGLRDDVSSPAIETRLLIEEALQGLSVNERDVVVMKAYTGMTFKEIAEVIDAPINTVSSWYRRGLNKMREYIEEVPNGRS